MKLTGIHHWLLTAVLAAGYCLLAGAAEPINTIVAVVNEEPVTRLEVEQEARRLQAINEGLSEEKALNTALDELIDRRIQLQLARRLRITISDAAVASRLQELRRDYGLASEAALEGAVRERFLMSLDEFRDRLREDMQIQTLFYREVFSRTQAYEDEVEQFLKSQEQISSAREYHLRHIMVTVAADGSDLDEKRELIVSVHARLTAGGDFSELAVRVSDDDSAAAGGDLGYRKEGQLPEAFLIEVHNLSPGDISEPINTSRGFHLLKLEAVRGGDIRTQIRRLLLSHVFLPLEAEAQAQEIWQGIASEADFNRAVTEHSVDEVSIGRNGDIGWFFEDELPPYFVDTATQMAVGDISVPVKSPYGWHILYLRQEDTEAVDVQVLREQARQVLRERRALAQRDVWLRRLRGDAHVRILDATFQAR